VNEEALAHWGLSRPKQNNNNNNDDDDDGDDDNNNNTQTLSSITDLS